MKQLNDIFDEIIWTTKETFEILLKWWVDVISLYMFYYYTAKRQKTNQPKATTSYSAKWIWITEKRIKEAKKYLIKYWLVEDFIDKDKWRIIWWYIKINYVFKKETIKKIWENPPSGKTHPVEKWPINALSNNNLNAINEKEELFNKFWNIYPRKIEKQKTKIIFMKQKEKIFNKIIEWVEKYKNECIKQKTEIKYIKYPTTWLNWLCWEDEYWNENTLWEEIYNAVYEHKDPQWLRENYNKFSYEEIKKNIKKARIEIYGVPCQEDWSLIIAWYKF